MTTPAFGSLGEAFLYCRDMDASLSERLDAFSSATRYLNPGYQEAVDRLVRRLKAYDAGKAAPKPGEPMPPFAMPDEQGHLVRLDALLAEGPLAMTFHRGHWCPYCRINTRAFAEGLEGRKSRRDHARSSAFRSTVQGRGAISRADRYRQWLYTFAQPRDLGRRRNAKDSRIRRPAAPRLSGE